MPSFQITNIEERLLYLKLLIYGVSGIGKTYLAGTAQDVPEMGEVLYCDVEGGITTLRERAGLKVVRISEYNQIIEVARYIQQNPGVYNTLVIDPLNTLFDLCMSSVSSDTSNIPSQRDWGVAGRKFLALVQGLYKVECNVIATCLERTTKDEHTGSVIYSVDLPGQSQVKVPAYFDIVGRLDVAFPKGPNEDPVRVLRVQPFGKYIAKDRWGLPPYVVEPTLDKIYHKKGNTPQ